MAGSPQHATLVANTTTTLTFDLDFPEVEVMSVDGAARVYFTVDGTEPAIGATGSHVLPAAIGFVTLEPRTSGPTVVKLKAATPVMVSVRGLL